MKYVLMPLILVLTGWATYSLVKLSPPKKMEFRPAANSKRDLRGECRSLVSLGWIESQKDYDGCVEHLTNPKYKIGESFKMKDSKFRTDCKFQVMYFIWSHGYSRNEPYYGGNVLCKNLNGKYELFDPYYTADEKELYK